jgi:hypothetical protein
MIKRISWHQVWVKIRFKKRLDLEEFKSTVFIELGSYVVEFSVIGCDVLLMVLTLLVTCLRPRFEPLILCELFFV